MKNFDEKIVLKLQVKNEKRRKIKNLFN